MKRIFLSLLLCGLGFSLIQAQDTKVTVSGTVWDAEVNAPIEQATVQILSLPDSAYINGNVSSTNGRFSLPAVKPGKYLLKVSYVGYSPVWKTLQLTASRPRVNVGRMTLSDEGILMKEAVIVAEAPQVQAVEDTLVYNSSAYRVPEGSALEELVKKLPGAEVDEDGNITVNGKTISKILVDGKEFFGNKKDMALKNLPVDMVEKLKTYEKKSDLARVTGIDDGDEETVLDLTVKKGMKQGWFGNADVAGGTKDRYSAKVMVNRFADNKQLTGMGSLGNTGDPGFGRRGGFRGGNNGLRTDKTGGFNFAIATPKIELGGNINYSYNNNDTESKTSSETFLETGNSFSNSLSKNFSRSTGWNGDFRLEWKPDTMTNIIFRPNFSYSTSESHSQRLSDSFNEDPYKDGITNPLEEFDDERLKDIRVNHQNQLSQSEGNSHSFNGVLQVNRRLNNKGRNITFRGSAGYSKNESEQISQSRIEYFQVEGRNQEINRYSTTPTKNWNYVAQLTYSEPVFKNTFLQFSYKYQYKYSKSDRSTYNIGDFEFPILPNGYDDEANYDADQSKFAEYKNYINDISANLRFIREKYQLNLGVTLMPQKSEMSYKKSQLDTLVTRTVTNFTPTVDFRYRFSKQTRLRISYRGSTDQPSMTDLLDITDDSNPLNITQGNPGLKPSFKNSLNASFDTYNVDKQQGINTSLSFENTLNDISNMVTYNTETGGRITKPENINGNWSVNGRFGFSSALKNNKKFTYNTNTSANYRNMVAYLLQNKETLKNTTRRMNIGERVSGGYRNDWFDVSLNGSLNYSHVRSSLQESSNMDTYDFSYGAESNVRFPWNMSVSTSISNSCRRGYSDANMNRDELIWNAQLSQNFLKGNAATLTLQVFDILHNQSNISRSISASQRRDTEYNSINSYCMVHFVYRLNLFGDKETRSKMRDMRNRGGFDGGFPPGGFGGGRGGFGGGRRM